jgi:CysZ protein
MLWHLQGGASSRYVGWIYWAYAHLVKVLLYVVVLVVMFYTFIVVANILASPVYDHLVSRYQRIYQPDAGPAQAISPVKGTLWVIKEEIKKAGLMLVVPLLLLMVPVIGPLLGFVVAALFIAWDYVDFSMSKDYPFLRDRIKALWRHKAFLLGFGCPLLVPVLGLVILPFAILGATRLYFDRIRPVPVITKGSNQSHYDLL